MGAFHGCWGSGSQSVSTVLSVFRFSASKMTYSKGFFFQVTWNPEFFELGVGVMAWTLPGYGV
ncbi:MAG: hypothetical protein WAK95_01665 [Desulfobacterales bacterium]